MLGNSLFGDELSTYSIVTGHSPGQILHILNGHSVDLTPPLFFELAWLSSRLGRTPELLRLFPFLAGVCAVPLTYRLGLRTVGRGAALGGALLVALSPFLIFYSTEARAYAVLATLLLGSTLALLRALDDGRARWWATYAALSCAAMYCHYTAIFILAVQAVWALITHRDRLPALLASNLAAAILFAPWLPVLIKNRHSFGAAVFNIIDPFGPRTVANDVAHWAVGHPFLTLHQEPGVLALVLIAVGAAAAALSAVFTAGRARGRRLPSSRAVLPCLLGLATPVGLAAYSSVGQSAWDGRNLISSWPGAALAAGALLTSPRPPLRLLTVGAVVAGFAIGAVQLLSPADQRPDYAAAAALIRANGSPHDPVAVIPAPTPGPYTAMDAALAYAGQPGHRVLRIASAQLPQVLAAPPYAFLPETPASRLAAMTEARSGSGRVFVVVPGVATVPQLLRSGVIDAPLVLGPLFGTGTPGRLYSTVFVPLSAYLRALAPRYRLVSTRRLNGFLPLSVYVLAAR